MPEVEMLTAGLLVAGVLTIGHLAGRSLSRHALLRGHAGHVLWSLWVRLPVSPAICGLVPAVLYSALNTGLIGRICMGSLSDNVSAAVLAGLSASGFCGGFLQRPSKPHDPARKRR